MMIAWKLTTDFNEQRHLFFEKIETDYIIESFICSCGHTDFITKHPQQELKYICEKCENTKFYDANSAWRNIVHFLYQNLDLKFSYEYDIQSDDDTINSLYVTRIPKSIDFSSRKVIYSNKPVYSLTLAIDGDLKENYSLRFEQKILSQLKSNLTQYINKNSCFNIPDSGENDFTISNVQFFLKHKNLKDFDFYYWADIDRLQTSQIYIKSALSFLLNSRKEKSLKRALAQNYKIQLQESKTFYSNFISVFITHIEDINILVQCLELQFISKMYSSISTTGLQELIGFLKEHYKDKQILGLFKNGNSENDLELLRDSINQYSYSKGIIQSSFQKVKCKLNTIHDELLRCEIEMNKEQRVDAKLSYTSKELSYCHLVDNYQVMLPNNAQELFEWADTLHNCLTGYFRDIQSKYTVVYGFFTNEVLQFAVEINEGQIVQQSAKYNIVLNDAELKTVKKWFDMHKKEK